MGFGMDAKELANNMADAINVKSNFLRSFAGGALELPVDLFYLGYDFLDTDNRWENNFDKERCIRLVKEALLTANTSKRWQITLFNVTWIR